LIGHHLCHLLLIGRKTRSLDRQKGRHVLSSNINRRHTTKGQRAMATAMVSAKLTTREAGTLSGTNRDVSRARAVLRQTLEAAPLVLSGALSLDMAYTHAQDLKRATEGQEEGMRRLRATEPDLAEKVVEGKLRRRYARWGSILGQGASLPTPALPVSPFCESFRGETFGAYLLAVLGRNA
jgi:hypothetical protein